MNTYLDSTGMALLITRVSYCVATPNTVALAVGNLATSNSVALAIIAHLLLLDVIAIRQSNVDMLGQ